MRHEMCGQTLGATFLENVKRTLMGKELKIATKFT